MKNFLIISAILIIPALVYILMNKDSNDFSAMADENGKPSLMTFTSTMCMDCQKMKAVIKEVEPSYSDKINFVSVNATDNNRKIKELVKRYNVVLVPTLIYLKDNKEVKRVEGAVSKEELISDIEEVING